MYDFINGYWEFEMVVPFLSGWNNTWIRDSEENNYIQAYFKVINGAISSVSSVLILSPPTTSGTISKNESWAGTHTLTGDVTIPNGVVLYILPGTSILFPANTSIICESGGRIEANGMNFSPIRFVRSDPNSAWDKILLQGDNNEFTWCLFDGGTYNVDIRSRYNTFTDCTFENAERGISTYKRPQGDWSSFELNECLVENNTNGVVASYTYGAIDQSTIQSNNNYGLYLSHATIGENNGGLSGLFTNNNIHDNGSYGILIGYYAKLWLGYGSTGGHNRIVNNGNHEIYLSSSSSSTRLYQSSISEGGSSGSGYSDIYDESLGYYIFNLAKTYSGEYYVSLTQRAENNYWNTTTAPSSSRFYGSVDRTPYKTASQAPDAGVTYVPKAISSSSEPVVAATVLSAGMASAIKSNTNSTEASQRLIDIKQRMLELLNRIRGNPFDLLNARRLNELYSLHVDEDPGNELGLGQTIFELINNKRENLVRMHHIIRNGNFNKENIQNDAIRLIGEVAMLLEIDILLADKRYNEALTKIEEYEPYIENSDNRRELLYHKLFAFETTGEYARALDVVQDLKEEVMNTENNPFYTPPTFEIIEENLMMQMGLYHEVFAVKKPVEGKEVVIIPGKFAVHQNYPNPFNPMTTIPFSLPEESHVKIEIYDLSGSCVATLSDKRYQAGNYNVQFNGSGLASGVYFIRTQMVPSEKQGKQHVFTSKMMLLK